MCCHEPIVNSATRETHRMLLNMILIIFTVLIALAGWAKDFFCSICASRLL